VNKNRPTPEHLGVVAEFRQQVYGLFEKQRDVLFEISDAIIQTPRARSYAELSQAPAMSRKWPSIYRALAEGEVNKEGLGKLCMQQLPSGAKRYHFACDVMAVRRMQSPTLKERVYCHGAQREVGGKGVIIGLPYSLVAYVEKPGTSWAPTVDSQRVKPDESAVEVAVGQAKRVVKQMPENSTAEIALDGGYGNLKFFSRMLGVKTSASEEASFASEEAGFVSEEASTHGFANENEETACECFATARMRNDRVFYQLPPPLPKDQPKKPGRPRKYGPAFRFADPSTWPTPDETLDFVDPKYGLVHLELWSALRLEVKQAFVDIAVVRSQIHLERDKPPAPHWYGVHNGTTQATTLERAFECITHRWPIEPANRFRKDQLYAQLPKLRQAQASDLWMTLLQIVEWELFIWRKVATDVHLPWQKPLPSDQLTPGRVIRSLSQHLPHLATPVKPVLPRGKAPGWPPGRPRTSPPTYRLVPKYPKKAKHTPKTSKNQ